MSHARHGDLLSNASATAEKISRIEESGRFSGEESAFSEWER
jgi:hypothetical protein